ncbi:MAG: oligosaccharide repeat unit polymerase [Lachnospiraceae bacterium]|nr:oligosaccharide repeat unit polymerase [Lachnospiraceae bacterium]
MNVYYLLVCLLIMTVFVRLINKGDSSSVSFYTCLSFLISVSLYVLDYKFFGTDLSFSTVKLIIESIVVLALGELLITKLLCNKSVNTKKMDYYSCIKVYKSEIKSNMLIVITMVIAIAKFMMLYVYARSIGFSGNPLMITEFMRGHMIRGEYGFPPIIVNLSYFVDSVTFYYLYLFFYQALFFNKYEKKLLIVLIAFIISSFASTGRSELISLVFFVISCFLHLSYNRKKQNTSRNQLKVKRYFYLSIAAIVALFFVFGNLRRGGGASFVDMIVKYYSSSLLGLDVFLNRDIPKNEVWGGMVFSNLYRFVDLFFGTQLYEPVGTNPFGSFFWLNDKGVDYSNIYTGFAIPIYDFGISGMLITRFFIGVFFGMLQKNRKYNRININHSIYIVMVCILMGCPLKSPISDLYFMFLSIGTVRYLVFLFIIKKFIGVREIKLDSESTSNRN